MLKRYYIAILKIENDEILKIDNSRTLKRQYFAYCSFTIPDSFNLQKISMTEIDEISV